MGEVSCSATLASRRGALTGQAREDGSDVARAQVTGTRPPQVQTTPHRSTHEVTGAETSQRQ